MIGSITLLSVGEPEWTEKIARELERADARFDILTRRRPAQAVSLIEGREIDGIVSAYDLPDQTGVEFLRTVRGIDPTVPFVIFTDTGSERIASDAISAGVSDYLLKDESDAQYSILANRLSTLVEAHRAEQIIDAAQSNWSDVREQLNDVYYLVTADWTEILYINSAYEAVWGESLSELQADPTSFLEYIHPEDRDAAVDSMHQLSNGQPSDIQYRIQAPTGETRWVRGVSEPIFNARGDVVRIMGAVRDISRRIEREQRFQAIFEDSLDAMVIADDSGTYLSVNDAACELFGLSESALIGRNVSEFAPPEYDIEAAWAEFQSTPGDSGLFPLQRPDGTRRIVEYEATRDIVPGEHLSILRDVTERERQRQELADSEARYQTLIEDVLETSSVGTFILDDDFMVVWMNRAIEEYFDIERANVLGRDQTDLIERDLKHKFDDPEAFARNVTRGYEDNTDTEEFECKIRNEQTGSWRWLKHWSQPIRAGLYEGGRIEHYTDITAVKHRDQQLQVLERVLRHNLQNKLNVVLGFAEAIASHTTGETKDQADRIITAANDLIALSAKEKRIVALINNSYDRRSIDLSSQLQACVDAFRDGFPNAQITADIPPDQSVSAVPAIDRAVVEVIENAIKHSDGSPEIAVSVTSSGEQVIISIRDDNARIPDLERSVLQGNVEIDQLSHSRGLGLWLASWVVTRSGGSITFADTRTGNDVQITLPTSRAT
ncbi:MAG: PAS domain S-box protein [Halorientalis sp.]